MKARLAADLQVEAVQNREAFGRVLEQSFGDKVKRSDLVAAAADGRIPQPTNVRFVDPPTLEGKRGAYSKDAGGTVLLDRSLRDDRAAMDRVYREESGHHLDATLGAKDAPGDEGELFARGLEKRGPLDAKTAQRIKAEDDRGRVTVDGARHEVEFADFGGGFARDGFGRGGFGRAHDGLGLGNQRPTFDRDAATRPAGPEGRTVDNGGFPPGVGPNGGTPTREQVDHAVDYMQTQMHEARAAMNDANASGDPQAYREAFGRYRELSEGTAKLARTMEHASQVGLIDPAGVQAGMDMAWDAEGAVLDNVTGYVRTFGDGAVPDRQTDIDHLAQISVGGEHAPPGTPEGTKTMAHKMWDRLQSEANRPGNEALRARLDKAAASAGQQAEKARELYDAALFEDDPAQRRHHIDALAKSGSLYYGTHIEALRATDAALNVGDNPDARAVRGMVGHLGSLARDGNYLAQRATRTLGSDFMDRYQSDDAKIRDRAGAALRRTVGDLREAHDTDRVDSIVHGLRTDAPLADLGRARARLESEVKRDNPIARRPLDRVSVQESLTRLKDDPEAMVELDRAAASGNPVARKAMQEILQAPSGGHDPRAYAPQSLERFGGDVRLPELETHRLTSAKLDAAKSLSSKTSRSEARTLAETLERGREDDDVRRAAETGLRDQLRAKNDEALRGVSDVLVQPTDADDWRLARLFREGRDASSFAGSVARVGRAAESGNERSIEALAGSSTVGRDAGDREHRIADRIEGHLRTAAAGGHADTVTKALITRADGGHGPQFYRTLGDAAARADRSNRWQNDQVQEHLHQGLSRGYDAGTLDPRSAHHGAAQGMAAMAEHLDMHDALELGALPSPSVVDALGTASAKLKPPVAEMMMTGFRERARSEHTSVDARNRSAEAMGRLGKWARPSDVDLLVRNFGQADDNRAAFSGVVNMLSRSDDARVRERAVHALMDDPRASWKKLSGVDAADKKRLVDYVAGTGDWELQGDIGKLIDGTGIRPPAPALFSKWGVEGTKDEIVDKSLRARAAYGDEAVRNLGANAQLWNRLGPDLRAQAMGWDPAKLSDAQRAQISGPIDAAWAADRMAQGTLHDTRGRVLLDDLGGRVEGLVADQRAAQDELTGELTDLGAQRERHLAKMTNTAGEGVGFVDETAHVLSWVNPKNVIEGRAPSARDQYEAKQSADVQKLREHERRMHDKANEVSDAARQRLYLESAQAAHERQRLLADGRHADADRVAMAQWQQHGDLLRQLDPEMHASLSRPDGAGGARQDGAWTRGHHNDRFHLDAAPEYRGDADQRFAKAAEVLSGPVKGEERRAVVQDALRTIDGDGALTRLNDAAGTLHQQLPTIQRMLASGAKGTAFDTYVDEVRARARPTLDALDQLRDDPKLMRTAERRLESLKALDTKMARHPAEERKPVRDRIDAIEGMLKMARDPHGVRGTLETVLDDSKFRADTWENWAKYDGPKVAGALAAGVAAAGVTVATFGAGAPLAAVAFAGAVGGTVGYEAASEGVHYYRNNFDPAVTNGRRFFSERSRAGHYAAGDQTLDATTGKWRDRELMDDVLAPYAWDVGTNFAASYLSLGAGKVLSGGINKVAGRLMGSHGDELAKMGPKLAQVEAVLGKEATQRTMKEILGTTMKRLPGELAGEVKDEAVDQFLQQGLTAVDPRLGMLSSVVTSTGRGVDIRAKGGNFTFDGKYADQAAKALRAEGYDVKVDANNGEMYVDTDAGRVRFTANEGTAPSGDRWRQIADDRGTPPPTSDDPAVLRDRAFASRQLADRLEQDVADGKREPGVRGEIDRLRTDARAMDDRADHQARTTAGAAEDGADWLQARAEDARREAAGTTDPQARKKLIDSAERYEEKARQMAGDPRTRTGDPTAPVITPERAVRAEAETLAANMGLPRDAAERIVAYRKDLEQLSALAKTDPIAAAKEARAAAEKWGLPPNLNEAIRIGSRELPRLRQEAQEIYDRMKEQGEDITHGEVLDYLTGEKFGMILRVGHDYNANGDGNLPRFPEAFQINGADGKPRPPDLNDPVERRLAEYHAKATIEEVMHSAGFELGRGAGRDYVPLFERTQRFSDFINSPKGREFLDGRGFKPDEIAEMQPKLLEADIMELHRQRAGFDDSEVGRYEVRRAYEAWLDAGEPATLRAVPPRPRADAHAPAPAAPPRDRRFEQFDDLIGADDRMNVDNLRAVQGLAGAGDRPAFDRWLDHNVGTEVKQLRGDLRLAMRNQRLARRLLERTPPSAADRREASRLQNEAKIIAARADQRAAKVRNVADTFDLDMHRLMYGGAALRGGPGRQPADLAGLDRAFDRARGGREASMQVANAVEARNLLAQHLQREAADGRFYVNTAGFPPGMRRSLFGGDDLTYHWDSAFDVGADGAMFVDGHEPLADGTPHPHGTDPHLQLHVLVDGKPRTVRIFWPRSRNPARVATPR